MIAQLGGHDGTPVVSQVDLDTKLGGQADELGGRIEAGRREMQSVLESEVARLERSVQLNQLSSQ